MPTCLDVATMFWNIIDWLKRAVKQFSLYIHAPRLCKTNTHSFLGISEGKMVNSGSFVYIVLAVSHHPSRSRPVSENWFTMAVLWHSAVPSSGMISPASQMVFSLWSFVRMSQLAFTISVLLWLVLSVCGCLIFVELPTALSAKHLVTRAKMLQRFGTYFTYGTSFTSSLFGLIVSAIDMTFTLMQEDGVQLASQSVMNLSMLVFHCILPPIIVDLKEFVDATKK